MLTRSRLRRQAPAGLAAFAVLGVMHLAVDGLTAMILPLQAVLAQRLTATSAQLGVLVAVSLTAATLLQPAAARLVLRYGELRAVVTGALLATAGYGLLPAAGSLEQGALAVMVGGAGSALFHPAAGGLLAGMAQPGREALPLALFSAVGTAGAAGVPIGVLLTAEALGAAAAVPAAAVLVLGAAVAALRLRASRSPHVQPELVTPGELLCPAPQPGTSQRPAAVLAPVLAAALIALAGLTANATAPVLLAQSVGPADPLLGVSVAAYSGAGAVGGVLLALLVRRVALRLVVAPAVLLGTAAATAIPHVQPGAVPVVMVLVGAGLSGSLPLLVTAAKRNGEASAAPAVARILGLSTGLGSLSYAGVATAQQAVGYEVALTVTVVAAGVAAALLALRLPSGLAGPDTLRAALSSCGSGSCACQPPARMAQ